MNDIISTETMMQGFSNLLDPTAQKIPSVWRKVVSRIKNMEDRKREDEQENADSYTEEISLGEKIAQNTHVVDLQKGVLLVEANHSGWIQYLRMYQKFILNGIKMECPEIQVKTLAYRTRGSDVSLFDNYEELLKKSQEKRKQEIEETERQVQDFYDNNGSDKENSQNDSKKAINPDLKDKINSLYEALDESMLTNSEK